MLQKILLSFFFFLNFIFTNFSYMDAAEPWQVTVQDPATAIMEGIINFHNFILCVFIFEV